MRFTPDPEWTANNVEVTKIDVSKWELSDKYVRVLSNILTKKECVELILHSEDAGYEQAKVNTGKREVLMTDVRNNDRCIIDSPVTMNFVWQRLMLVCGDDANLMRASFKNDPRLHAVGLNGRMRILRYVPGTYFTPHCDGRYTQDAVHSCVTFQLYLNEGFEGGSTKLLNSRNRSEGFDVVPATGSVLLFQHDVFHEGALLQQGRKYALRTDVMYATAGGAGPFMGAF